MALRILVGVLAPWLPHQYNDSEIMETHEAAGGEDITAESFGFIKDAAKFHIGMLTVSLLATAGYGGFVGYKCWKEKEIFLGYVRNLVIALFFRTFFTIIFDGTVLLKLPYVGGGANVLSAFEQILLNLVLGLWLSLTIYAHARVQRNFKSEPTLRLYQYGVPAVAAFFALVWIFTLQDLFASHLWWIINKPLIQWITNAANLLFLLIQLCLVGDMCRMMLPVKASLDQDSLSLLWKVAAMMAALILIFWLHFGLSTGTAQASQSYIYFFFFIDGLEGALVCACLFFFCMWVDTLLINKHDVLTGSGETIETGETLPGSTNQEFLPERQGIVTIDSMLTVREDRIWKNSNEEAANDVVYSNVVDQHRLEKTLELYKRLNVIPKPVTVVEGEEFYDCQIPAESPTENLQQNFIQKQKAYVSCPFKNERMLEPSQKKNAFYASKYLILDQKESNIPRYLETLPSESSVVEKNTQKKNHEKNFESLGTDELVKNWLKNESLNTENNRQKEFIGENSNLEPSKPPKLRTSMDMQDLHKGKIVSLTPNEEINLKSEQRIPNRLGKAEQNTEDTEDTEKYFSDSRKQNGEDSEVSTPGEKETPTNAEGIKSKELGPVEIVPPQRQHESVSPQQLVHPKFFAPDKINMEEPESNDKQNLYLTYAQLQEFRSKRDNFETYGPAVKNSMLEDVFSKVDSLFTTTGSIFGYLFSQRADDSKIMDSGTADRLPGQDDLKSKTEALISEEGPETKKAKIKDSEVGDKLPRPPQDVLKHEPERVEKFHERSETKEAKIKDSEVDDKLPRPPQDVLKHEPERMEKFHEGPKTKKAEVKDSEAGDKLPRQPQVDLKPKPEAPRTESTNERRDPHSYQKRRTPLPEKQKSAQSTLDDKDIIIREAKRIKRGSTPVNETLNDFDREPELSDFGSEIKRPKSSTKPTTKKPLDEPSDNSNSRKKSTDSSSSEFSIERTRSSSTLSSRSFSVEQYYATVKAAARNFADESSPLHLKKKS